MKRISSPWPDLRYKATPGALSANPRLQPGPGLIRERRRETHHAIHSMLSSQESPLHSTLGIVSSRMPPLPARSHPCSHNVPSILPHKSSLNVASQQRNDSSHGGRRIPLALDQARKHLLDGRQQTPVAALMPCAIVSTMKQRALIRLEDLHFPGMPTMTPTRLRPSPVQSNSMRHCTRSRDHLSSSLPSSGMGISNDVRPMCASTAARLA